MKVITIFFIFTCIALSQENAIPFKTESLQGLGDICDICKNVAQTIKDDIESLIDEDEIKTDLEELCSLISDKSFQETCITNLDKILDDVLNDIKSETPEKVCKELELC